MEPLETSDAPPGAARLAVPDAKPLAPSPRAIAVSWPARSREQEMSERQRRWSWWAEKGAVAVATLAAFALAITVWLTQHALDSAADVLVRGDGDALVASVIGALSDAEWPVTSKTLSV